ncbi:MAG: hypothetical protein ACK5TK_15905 [Betaproteobacteria bacterium]
MSFFGKVADKVGKGLDWGKGVAQSAWDGTRKAADAVVDYAKDKAQQAEEAVSRKAEELRDRAHEAARKKAAAMAKDKDLLDSLDQRDRFKSKVVQDCATTGPPVPYDGHYLSKSTCDCASPPCSPPTKQKPPKGAGFKPKGCENCGKDFPATTYTNGIDNTMKNVCDTMRQLADELCMEVVGVYNASYKDAVPPTRSAEENMALLTKGAQGAKKGLVDGVVEGIPEAIGAGVATGGLGGVASLLKSGAKGAAMGAGEEAGLELLKQEAPRRLAQSQDLLDVIDTLKGRSTQPPTDRLSREIVGAMSAGQSLNVIGHSEGGVNTVAAIGQAKSELVEVQSREVLKENPNLDDEAAGVLATKQVEAALGKNLNVTLLGTQQTGLPDGPNYVRAAHKSDFVPDAISGAQDAIGRPGHDRHPLSGGQSSAPVERFPLTTADGKSLGPTGIYSPLTAHSMENSYIPYLRDKAGRAPGQPCC